MLYLRLGASWNLTAAEGGVLLLRHGARTLIPLSKAAADEVVDAVYSPVVDSRDPKSGLSPTAAAALAWLDNRSVLAVEMVVDGRLVARFEPGSRHIDAAPEREWADPPRAVGSAHIRIGESGPELAGGVRGGRVLLMSTWAMERAAHLLAGTDCADVEDNGAEFIELVARADLLEPKDSGCDDDAWTFHDTVFHAATRIDTSSGAFGARPDIASAPPGREIRRPTASRLVDLGSPARPVRKLDVVEAMNSRRSVRRHGGIPIGRGELSAVLDQSVRVHRRVETPTGELAWRCIPTGGARSGLSVVVLVNVASDIDRGAYEYDAVGHKLAAVGGPSQAMDRWLALGQRLTGTDATTVQVMVLFTLDYGRPAHAYDSIVYATALKEVGAAFQAMSLVCTDLSLAFCPLGSGFATTAGLSECTAPAVVVGEAILGRSGSAADG